MGLTRARGETDFFGPACPRPHGSEANTDQILLSSISKPAIEPPANAIRIVRPRRTPFKGHRTDPRLSGLRIDPLDVFPPMGGKRETASGDFPANLSSFLGRERELNDLGQWPAGQDY